MKKPKKADEGRPSKEDDEHLRSRTGMNPLSIIEVKKRLAFWEHWKHKNGSTTLKA